MRDYPEADALEEDSDAVIRQMKDVLRGKAPLRAYAARKQLEKLPKGTNLVLALVHSLRNEVRVIGGMEAPEELVLETRAKRHVFPIVQKSKTESVRMPETNATPEPLLITESEPEPEMPSESMSEVQAAPLADAEPLLEHEPQKLPEPLNIPKPEKIKFSAGDDEDDDEDENDEEGEEDEEDEDDQVRIRKPGTSKKLLLRLLKRIARRRSKSKSAHSARRRRK